MRTEADILPGNVARNDNIRLLRERWQCNLTTCHSDHCYVPADGPHFRLSHDLLAKWAAAMVRTTLSLTNFSDYSGTRQLHRDGGEPSATLERPPNTHEFDQVSAHTIVSKSPLLQARLNAMSKERGSVINVVLPNNIGGYPTFPAAVPQAQVFAPAADSPLLPANLSQGPKMDIESFCSIYSLSDDLLSRFREHRVSGTHAFAHISIKELKEMDFKIGEIIDVKEAVTEWCRSGS